MDTSKLWVHPEKRRYYRVWIYQDLLGHWVLTREWGALDSKLGGIKTELLTGPQHGNEKMEEITRRRRTHQYQLISKPNFTNMT